MACLDQLHVWTLSLQPLLQMLKLECGTTQKNFEFPLFMLHHPISCLQPFFLSVLDKKEKTLAFLSVSVLLSFCPWGSCWEIARAVIALEGKCINTMQKHEPRTEGARPAQLPCWRCATQTRVKGPAELHGKVPVYNTNFGQI